MDISIRKWKIEDAEQLKNGLNIKVNSTFNRIY